MATTSSALTWWQRALGHLVRIFGTGTEHTEDAAYWEERERSRSALLKSRARRKEIERTIGRTPPETKP